MKKSPKPRHRSDRQSKFKGQNRFVPGQNNVDSLYAAYLQNGTSRGSSSEEDIYLQPLKENFLEKELEPGDTLQTLSIQFNCPIAELKRINNMHRDNEVFARRIIKVPLRYYSLLAQKVAGVHKVSTPTSVTPSEPVEMSSVQQEASALDVQIRNGLCLLKEGDCSNPNNDKVVTPTECDVSSRLLPIADTPISATPDADVFDCSGSDWGLSWFQLLSCTLMLLLGGPVVYLFYTAGYIKTLHSN